MEKEDPRAKYIFETSPDSVDVWVCQDWFPIGTYSKNRAGFPMNRLLKTQLDYLIKNVQHDWDFTLLICGEGEVRIGKSTLAQQISTYWTWSLTHLLNITLPHSVKENMALNGAELISKGNKLGRKTKFGALIFDEAGADLEAIKVMKGTTQAVKDYLRECGQYNMLNIMVLPEFFDLPKSIALNRSIALINVYWLPDYETGMFERGYFKFYNKPDKKKLYLKGKKELDYNTHPATFEGQFPRFYTYNEEEYLKAKREALKNREKISTKETRFEEVLYAIIKILRDKYGYSLEKMRDEINQNTFSIKISMMFLSRFIRRMIQKNDVNEKEWEDDLPDGDSEEESEKQKS